MENKINILYDGEKQELCLHILSDSGQIFTEINGTLKTEYDIFIFNKDSSEMLDIDGDITFIKKSDLFKYLDINTKYILILADDDVYVFPYNENALLNILYLFSGPTEFYVTDDTHPTIEVKNNFKYFY